MRIVAFFLLLAALPMTVTNVLANCMPVKSDVVSLGEAVTRSYATRRLEEEKTALQRSIEASGAKITRIGDSKVDCAPFPNLIGADEWRCIGGAKICVKR